jgi:predicted heme/steroid binding protein
MDTPYRILVTGSRYAQQEVHGAFIEEQLAMARNKPSVMLVHGGAPGVDSICDQVARSFGWDVEVHEANWAEGKGAGPERNKRMVKAGADVVLAFPLTGALNKGTKHCSTFAEINGLTVHYFELAPLT